MLAERCLGELGETRLFGALWEQVAEGFSGPVLIVPLPDDSRASQSQSSHSAN